MPIDPITGAAIVTAIGGGANAFSQGRQNRKSRKWSEKMYERQKADNLQFWEMQNKYNAPQEQMKRLQEGGLNPNLVYGSGQAQQPSANIQSPDTPRPEFNPVELGAPLQQLGSYFDLELKQAQTDNLKAQTTVKQEEAILTLMKSTGEGYSNMSKHMKAQLDTDLFETNAEMVKEKLRKLKAETNYSLDSNERANLMFNPTIQNAFEDILTKRLGRQVTAQQLKNLGLDQKVKELDAKFASMQIRPTDPFYVRAIGELLGWAHEQLQKGGLKTPKLPFINK